jgi:hypothetical protein
MQTIAAKTHWRYRLSRRLLPYYRAIAAIFLGLMTFPLLDTYLGWGILGLSGRRAEALTLAAGLIFYIVLAPDLHLQTLTRTWRRKAARDHSQRF